MQSGQMLSPNGILASQKVHAAVSVSVLVLDAASNRKGYARKNYYILLDIPIEIFYQFALSFVLQFYSA
jgi:hypothetical protein